MKFDLVTFTGRSDTGIPLPFLDLIVGDELIKKGHSSADTLLFARLIVVGVINPIGPTDVFLLSCL